MALLVGRMIRAGTSAAESRWATDWRQVNAIVISSRRQSRHGTRPAWPHSRRPPGRHAGRGHAQFRERVLDVGAAQYVYADPAEALADLSGGAEQRCVQRTSGQRHIAGLDAERAGLLGVFVRHLTGEQAGIDARPEPQYLVGGFLLAAVRGGTSLRAGAAEAPLADAPGGLAAGWAAPPGSPLSCGFRTT